MKISIIFLILLIFGTSNFVYSNNIIVSQISSKYMMMKENQFSKAVYMQRTKNQKFGHKKWF